MHHDGYGTRSPAWSCAWEGCPVKSDDWEEMQAHEEQHDLLEGFPQPRQNCCNCLRTVTRYSTLTIEPPVEVPQQRRRQVWHYCEAPACDAARAEHFRRVRKGYDGWTLDYPPGSPIMREARA